MQPPELFYANPSRSSNFYFYFLSGIAYSVPDQITDVSVVWMKESSVGCFLKVP